MASDVSQHELVTSSLPVAAPLTNGNHDPSMATEESRNVEAYAENAAVSKVDPCLTASTVAPENPTPAGPTLIEHVAPGIAPAADFIPKDAPASHPTPPPDEPLATSEANIDSDMAPTDDAPAKEPAPAPEPEPAAEPMPALIVTSNESSLVRPREEDEDGEEDMERAAKRSRTEDVPMQDTPADGSHQPAVAKPDELTEKQFVASGHDSAESAVAKADPSEGVSTTSPPTHAAASETPLPQSGVPVTNGDSVPSAQAEGGTVVKPAGSDVKSADTDNQPAAAAAAPSSAPSVPAAKSHRYSTAPMTKPQLQFLIDKMKNLKKTKNSHFFLRPVDPVALAIPTYFDVVKHPMDLSTMDQKLKAGEYKTVQEFADDFDLITSNSIKFNGPQHAVSQAGMSMEAYFRKMMQSVPSADQQPNAHAKKASPKLPPAVRREFRGVTAPTAAPTPPRPAAPPAGGSSEPFALQADGTPQIRRESTTNRPARAIKPPPARELAYAKPKRKEHQVELKFVEWLLNQLKGPKYANVNHVFQAPVDPVALNIPHYRQIVKTPMDLSTMTQKLKQGQYGRAVEFRKDFELMIQNCLAFNPPGNVVRDLGVQFQREFDGLWRTKEQWEKKRKAENARATSASADEDSGEEEEDDEDEEPTPAHSAATIAALQKQLADMQNAIAGLGGGAAAPKAKKAKAPKAAKKGGASAPKAAKTASSKSKTTKKVKQVTYEEKQEISEAVGNMDTAQVEQLTNIITSNCKKYADQEEMELEIDDLPNDVQVLLLQYVRSIFGNPNKRVRQASPDDMANIDDDDFEPPARSRGGSGGGGGGGGKRKKHKPMGKQEQQAAITTIQKQLAQFQNPGRSGSASPTNSYPAQDADTSGDDESEESEEE